MGVAIPPGLADLLARPMDGVARVVVTHEVHRRFRWLVVLELILCGIGCLVLLPCAAVAVLGGSKLDNFDLPDIQGRMHSWWQELVVKALDPQGVVLAEARSRPADAGAAHGIITAVLGAAQRQGVVIVETLLPFGSQTAETRHVWYGGRSLFASPAMRAEEAAAEVLAQSGWKVERLREVVVVSHALPRPRRVVAWLILILCGCALMPLLLLGPGRQFLKDLWADAKGEAPPQVSYTIRAGSLEVRTTRSDEIRECKVIDGADLLGVVFAPSLSWSKHRIVRRPPSLNLVSEARQVTLGVIPELGPAFRDLITAATIRLRTESPELGLLAGPRPTRCPFCSQLYLLETGSRCPNCGAPGVVS